MVYPVSVILVFDLVYFFILQLFSDTKNPISPTQTGPVPTPESSSYNKGIDVEPCNLLTLEMLFNTVIGSNVYEDCK